LDRAAVLRRDPAALLASVLNPPTNAAGRQVLPSVMPFLAREGARELAVEALLRPRMPVIAGPRMVGRSEAVEEGDDLDEGKVSGGDLARERDERNARIAAITSMHAASANANAIASAIAPESASASANALKRPRESPRSSTAADDRPNGAEHPAQRPAAAEGVVADDRAELPKRPRVAEPAHLAPTNADARAAAPAPLITPAMPSAIAATASTAATGAAATVPETSALNALGGTTPALGGMQMQFQPVSGSDLVATAPTLAVPPVQGQAGAAVDSAITLDDDSDDDEIPTLNIESDSEEEE
ncbi:hypothetical protein KEM52_003100, partial [Ascosphaera acerosa]